MNEREVGFNFSPAVPALRECEVLTAQENPRIRKSAPAARDSDDDDDDDD